MSTVICDYCGTIYDPKNGPCPICGGEQYEEPKEETVDKEPEAAPAAAEPEPTEAPETPEEAPAPVEVIEPIPEAEPVEEEPAVPQSLGDTKIVKVSEIAKAAQAEEPAAPEAPEAPAPSEPAEPAETAEPEEDAPAGCPEMPVFTEDLDITLEELDAPEEPEERPLPKAMQPAKKKKRSSKASRVICGILAILVVGFAMYIGYRFARPYIFPAAPSEATTVPTESAAPTTEPSKECTAILVEKNVSLTEAGQTLQLAVELTPVDTVDKLTFISDNPAVATVTEDGLVTAVNTGRANITITCGNVMASCAVDCEFAPVATESPTTEPVETRPANPTTHYLTFEDKVHLTGDVDEVTLSLSDDSDLHLRLRKDDANGKVLSVDWVVEKPELLEMDVNSFVPKAVGDTMVTGVYDGEEYHCLVHIVE